MSATTETIEQVENLAGEGYKHGFVTDIEMDMAPKGLSEDVVRFISAKKNEPEWMLEWRLKAYRLWLTQEMPSWQKLDLPEIDYQDSYYYAAPKSQADGPQSLDDVDPELLQNLREAGHSLARAGVSGGRHQYRGGCGVRQCLGRDHVQERS